MCVTPEDVPNTPEFTDPIGYFNGLNELPTPVPAAAEPLLNPEGDPRAVAEIAAAIEAGGGKIPFSHYMRLALYGQGGYYSQGKVPFQSIYQYGKPGHFVTAPLESEDFSRGVAHGVRRIADALDGEPFNLVEPGAGTGRMAKDVLAALRVEAPDTYKRAQLWIADYGGMTGRQKHTMASDAGAHPGSYAARSSSAEHAQDLAKTRWVPGSVLELGLDNDRPTVVTANEIPDAAEVDVVRNLEGVVEQKFVGMGERGVLIELWHEPTEQVWAYMQEHNVTPPLGREVAIGIEVVNLCRSLAQLVTRGGIINTDYGQFRPRYAETVPYSAKPVGTLFGQLNGNDYTMGAVGTYPKNFNPLQMPGELDMTHNPDFALMRRVWEGAGMETAFKGAQAQFLEWCGMPNSRELDYFLGFPGMSEASIARLNRALSVMTGYQALVMTKCVEIDREYAQEYLPGYRGLASYSP